MSKLHETSSAKRVIVFAMFGLFSVIFLGLVFSFTTDISPGASQNYTFSSWLVLAYLAGLSMIVLPCTLPFVFMIVPMTIDKGFKKGLLIASLFGAGLVTTITLYGVGLAYLGQVTGLSELSTWLMLVAGIITYSYGLHRLGLVKIPTPSYSRTPGFMKNRGDYSKTFFMGLLVGNAGVGCTNPLFYLMLFYIMSTGDPATGFSLGFVHGIGRAIPLVLVAVLALLGFNPAKGLVAKRQKVEKISAVLLIAIGSFLIVNSTPQGQSWFMNTISHTVWNDFVDYSGMSENMKILMMPGAYYETIGHPVPIDEMKAVSTDNKWKLYFWWEPKGEVAINQSHYFYVMFHEPITNVMQDNVHYDMDIFLNDKLLESRTKLYASDGWDKQEIIFPVWGTAKIVFKNIEKSNAPVEFAFEVTKNAVVIQNEKQKDSFSLEIIPVFTAIMIAVPLVISKAKNRKQNQ